MLHLGPQTPEPLGHVEADAAGIAGQRLNGLSQSIEFRSSFSGLAATMAGSTRAQNAIEGQRPRELLANAIGHSPQTYAVRLLQPAQSLNELPTELLGQAGESPLPGKSRDSLALARQRVVDQKKRLEPPGLTIVSGLEAEKIKQEIKILAVVGLWRRGVVVLVFLIVFDNGLQDTGDPAPRRLQVATELKRWGRANALFSLMHQAGVDASMQNTRRLAMVRNCVKSSPPYSRTNAAKAAKSCPGETRGRKLQGLTVSIHICRKGVQQASNNPNTSMFR